MQLLPKLDKILDATGGEPDVQIGNQLYLDVALRSKWEGVCLYWRLIDPEYSLLEIGVDSASGELRSLTVPLYNGDIDVRASVAGKPVSSTLGTPVFSTTHWPSDWRETRHRFVDVPGRIRLDCGPDDVRIVISDESVHRSVQVGARLVCELNDADDLVGFRILAVCPEERQRLMSESEHARASRGRIVGR